MNRRIDAKFERWVLVIFAHLRKSSHESADRGQVMRPFLAHFGASSRESPICSKILEDFRRCAKMRNAKRPRIGRSARRFSKISKIFLYRRAYATLPGLVRRCHPSRGQHPACFAGDLNTWRSVKKACNAHAAGVGISLCSTPATWSATLCAAENVAIAGSGSGLSSALPPARGTRTRESDVFRESNQ